LRVLTSAGHAVLGVRHAGWGESGARGASAFEGAVDVIMAYSRLSGVADSDRRRVLTAKGRLPGIPDRIMVNEPDAPGPTIDDKHEWLTRHEKKPRWDTVITSALARVYPVGIPANIDEEHL
jgi:hypothetical protein